MIKKFNRWLESLIPWKRHVISFILNWLFIAIAFYVMENFILHNYRSWTERLIMVTFMTIFLWVPKLAYQYELEKERKSSGQ